MKKFLLIMAICATFTFNRAALADNNQDWIVDIPASEAKNAGNIDTRPAKEEHLLDNKIYFFAHAMCPKCKDAFIYIYTNHSDLNIPITDMKFHHNFELYKECVQKFNIKNQELRLPLICMGDTFIMGWEENYGNIFEQNLAAFNAQNAEQQ